MGGADSESGVLLKENVWRGGGEVGGRWLGAVVGGAVVLAVCAWRADTVLPEVATKPGLEDFSAARAAAVLRNLTALGPRVAGSYENEVGAVSAVLEALRGVARDVGPHARLEVDTLRGSGAFPLTFFDGMTNVYRDVQGVVARLSAAPAAPPLAPPPRALLLNCHYDTVPDSPGASDDAAGCAVLVEVLRAVGAGGTPPAAPVLLLLNGAEENIMQGSHAFVTLHAWARQADTFVNVEACGAGGRELLFQAGPRAGWLLRQYADTVPRPFASSLAQEVFASGVVPGDTDFRVFRDHGGMSGLDLAWSADGYVYHTRLDEPGRVPLPALQRTGDNVLALVRGLLQAPELGSGQGAPAAHEGEPVFFDVLGVWVVVLGPGAAAALAALTALLLGLRLHVSARHARTQVRGWRVGWRGPVSAGASAGAAAVCGVCASALVGAGVHAGGAALAYYARPLLLLPMYGAPALAASLWVTHALAPTLRPWVAVRRAADGGAVLWGALLLVCAWRGLRSGLLPALWVAGGALADLAVSALRAGGGARAAAALAGGVGPALQTAYLALGTLRAFVPVTGRSGTPPLPPDALLGALTGALVLACLSPAVPLLAHNRHRARLVRVVSAVGVMTAALVLLGPLYTPYTAARPQRLLVLHARRTLHAPPGEHAPPHDELLYWAPQLDPNTRRTAHALLSGAVRGAGAEECERWPYCGAPYLLPVLGLLARGYTAPALGEPPADARTTVHVTSRYINDTARELTLLMQGPPHLVVIVAPPPRARLTWYDAQGSGAGRPQPGAHSAGRQTYFFTLHAARAAAAGAASWRLVLVAEGADTSRVQLSVSGHALSGARHEHHAALLARAPPHVAASGWPVHTHLLTV